MAQSIWQSNELLLMSDEIREMMASRSCLLQRAAECGFACRGSLENSRPDRDRLFILMSLSFCSEACMSSRYSLHCGTCRKRIHDQRSNNKFFHYSRWHKQKRSDVRADFLGRRWTPRPHTPSPARSAFQAAPPAHSARTANLPATLGSDSQQCPFGKPPHFSGRRALLVGGSPDVSHDCTEAELRD